ncbi:hypothetical protein GGI43DRAFT_396470 [Trichoderma evansii]
MLITSISIYCFPLWLCSCNVKAQPHHGSRGAPFPIPILPIKWDPMAAVDTRYAGASAKKHEARAVPFLLTTQFRFSC